MNAEQELAVEAGQWRRPAIKESEFGSRRTSPNKVHQVADLLPNGLWQAVCDPATQMPLLPGRVDNRWAEDVCKKCAKRGIR